MILSLCNTPAAHVRDAERLEDRVAHRTISQSRFAGRSQADVGTGCAVHRGTQIVTYTLTDSP